MAAFHTCYFTSLLEELREKTLGSLPLVSCVPFPFAGFALYHFTVIKHGQEHGFMQSPVNSPGKSLNLGVVLGTPDSDGLVLLLFWDGMFLLDLLNPSSLMGHLRPVFPY